MLGPGLFGSAPVPSIKKKTRVQLTHTEKRRICEVQILNPQWTQEKISLYTSQEFRKSIGRALVSKILKEGEKWNSLPDDEGGRTRIRTARHVQLEEGLFLWFQKVSWSIQNQILNHILKQILILNQKKKSLYLFWWLESDSESASESDSESASESDSESDSESLYSNASTTSDASN